MSFLENKKTSQSVNQPANCEVYDNSQKQLTKAVVHLTWIQMRLSIFKAPHTKHRKL